LKSTIHNITISLRAKENFTCCDTKCPGRRESSGRTQVSSTHSPNVKRKLLVQRNHLMVPSHKFRERESDVIRRHGNKFKIRLTDCGRWDDLIELFKITALHLIFRQLQIFYVQRKRPSAPLRLRDGWTLSPAFTRWRLGAFLSWKSCLRFQSQSLYWVRYLDYTRCKSFCIATEILWSNKRVAPVKLRDFVPTTTDYNPLQEVATMTSWATGPTGSEDSTW
jgi:hypothetical protein